MEFSIFRWTPADSSQTKHANLALVTPTHFGIWVRRNPLESTGIWWNTWGSVKSSGGLDICVNPPAPLLAPCHSEVWVPAHSSCFYWLNFHTLVRLRLGVCPSSSNLPWSIHALDECALFGIPPSHFKLGVLKSIVFGCPFFFWLFDPFFELEHCH